ncbi:MAG: 4Fe-4S binding protein [Proteobacteria bacterium]|jgi:NAD-dependent dihydropyrimidine dehydrogenase PreA subunit|nr:4Fe-4S binding protein [Pseudomonadota bacterium]
MNFFKFVWGLLFRLFPCPTPTGLRKIGNPTKDSPVLLTCNFDLTVRRLHRQLDGWNLWLIVAESKGVNVWCAAGADEFNTHSVVSAIKTSAIADEVEHRQIILPPLGAPGIRKVDVEEQTGWTVEWGPVRAKDIPRFLAQKNHRSESMKRTTYDLWERLDTALGSLFLFFLVGAAGFAIFGRSLFLDYLLVGSLVFVSFFLTCPWIPGTRGIIKGLLVSAVLLGLYMVGDLLFALGDTWLGPDLLIAIFLFPLFGAELGGLASTLPSDFDPLLAKMGIKSISNTAFAGTVRTDLLNGWRELTYHHDRCISCKQCIEICPLGVWELGNDGRADFANPTTCTACTACLKNCTSGAIQAKRT